MGGLSLAFVIAPCIGGVAAAAVLRDWRLAGALSAGAFGLMFFLAAAAGPFSTIALPFVGGIAVGSLAMVAHLRFLPQATIWGRMSTGLTTVFVLSVVNLFIFAGPN